MYLTYFVEFQNPISGVVDVEVVKSKLEMGDRLRNKVQNYLNKNYKYYTSYVPIYTILPIFEWVEVKSERATKLR